MGQPRRVANVQQLSDMLKEFYTPSRLTKLSGSEEAILEMWERIACTRNECGGCARCRAQHSVNYGTAERLANELMVALRTCTPSERHTLLHDLREPYCDGCGDPRGCQCQNDE